MSVGACRWAVRSARSGRCVCSSGGDPLRDLSGGGVENGREGWPVLAVTYGVGRLERRAGMESVWDRGCLVEVVGMRGLDG